jgi:DNA-3-methyladenine glycosylase
MHWMLNFVTEQEGYPAAVLLRAVEPAEGHDLIRQRRAGRPESELTTCARQGVHFSWSRG